MSAPVDAADVAAAWGVVGHAQPIRDLVVSIQRDQIPHALLITGPEGVGRTTVALGLARALLCEQPPAAGIPCNSCDACRRVRARVHPDLLVADMAWQEAVLKPEKRVRTTFSIDAVHQLRAEVSTRPTLGRWKVVILDAASRLGGDSAEALLKTLEEPPPYIVMILIVPSADVMPETIRSRCRSVVLGLVAHDEIVTELVGRGVDAHRAGLIASMARGRMAEAFHLADDPDAILRRRERVEEAFEQISTVLGRITIAGTFARDASRKRDATQSSAALWAGLWHDGLLLRAGLSEYIGYPEIAERLTQYVAPFDYEELYRALWATHRCINDLGANVQPRIALQAMVMQWPL